MNNSYVSIYMHLLIPTMSYTFTFTFMHLADAFIQSDLQYMKFRNEVYKLGSGGARQILSLINTGGTQSSRAGRYDQKFISRYFSKLYRFHGI